MVLPYIGAAMLPVNFPHTTGIGIVRTMHSFLSSTYKCNFLGADNKQ